MLIGLKTGHHLHSNRASKIKHPGDPLPSPPSLPFTSLPSPPFSPCPHLQVIAFPLWLLLPLSHTPLTSLESVTVVMVLSSHTFPSLPFPSFPFLSFSFPSLPFPSLPFPSLSHRPSVILSSPFSYYTSPDNSIQSHGASVTVSQCKSL